MIKLPFESRPLLVHLRIFNLSFSPYAFRREGLASTVEFPVHIHEPALYQELSNVGLLPVATSIRETERISAVSSSSRRRPMHQLFSHGLTLRTKRSIIHVRKTHHSSSASFLSCWISARTFDQIRIASFNRLTIVCSLRVLTIVSPSISHRRATICSTSFSSCCLTPPLSATMTNTSSTPPGLQVSILAPFRSGNLPFSKLFCSL
jgi:hypothetical protein